MRSSFNPFGKAPTLPIVFSRGPRSVNKKGLCLQERSFLYNEVTARYTALLKGMCGEGLVSLDQRFRRLKRKFVCLCLVSGMLTEGDWNGPGVQCRRGL